VSGISSVHIIDREAAMTQGKLNIEIEYCHD
jgi:hypothetical protein